MYSKEFEKNIYKPTHHEVQQEEKTNKVNFKDY